jgi:hypothetical protein
MPAAVSRGASLRGLPLGLTRGNSGRLDVTGGTDVDTDPEAANMREMAGALRAAGGDPGLAPSRRLMPSTSYRSLSIGVGTGLVVTGSGSSPFGSPSHSPDLAPRTLSRQSSFSKHQGGLEEGGTSTGPDYTDAELEAMSTPRSFLGRQNSFLIHSATALGAAGKAGGGGPLAAVAPLARPGQPSWPVSGSFGVLEVGVPMSGVCMRGLSCCTVHRSACSQPHQCVFTTSPVCMCMCGCACALCACCSYAGLCAAGTLRAGQP